MLKVFSMSFVIVNNKNKLLFQESILSKLLPNSLEAYIEVKQLEDGNVNITKSDKFCKGVIPIMRPSFCPIAHLEMIGHRDSQSEFKKGVAVACTVFLENDNGEVLLTKRAAKLRSFPNVWVPPGGHVDALESLESAALRELFEETGLKYSPENVNLTLICAWESAFPTVIEFGMPRSHHLVLYYVATINKVVCDLDKLAIGVDEVSAFAWLNRRQIAEVVRTFADPLDFSLLSNIIPSEDDEVFKCTEVELMENKLQYKSVMRPLSVLTASVDNISDLINLTERVSTGTKYGLYQWLILNIKKDKK